MLNVVIFIENTINDLTEFHEHVNDNLRIFCQQNCAEFSNFGELLDESRK